MDEEQRLKQLVAIYRNALIEISNQEEIEDMEGNKIPSTEMDIAQQALENGKALESVGKEICPECDGEGSVISENTIGGLIEDCSRCKINQQNQSAIEKERE